MYDLEKHLLPEFPRTMHLPIEPNATSDDKIASEDEMNAFLTNLIVVEEKIDGANSGIRLHEGMPIIRNRSHILNKTYPKRKTPAQTQFSAVYTWFYENLAKFQQIEKSLGFVPSVYGEWMYAQHSVEYDLLPDLWIPYDIYNPDTQQFICPNKSREVLTEAGFHVAPLIQKGMLTPKELITLRDAQSQFSSHNKREGIYLKATDGEKIIGRYKMVAPWFKTNDNWIKLPLVRNKISQ
jgi:hypothetical protein